jgi:hypothetical protein
LAPTVDARRSATISIGWSFQPTWNWLTELLAKATPGCLSNTLSLVALNLLDSVAFRITTKTPLSILLISGDMIWEERKTRR